MGHGLRQLTRTLHSRHRYRASHFFPVFLVPPEVGSVAAGGRRVYLAHCEHCHESFESRFAQKDLSQHMALKHRDEVAAVGGSCLNELVNLPALDLQNEYHGTTTNQVLAEDFKDQEPDWMQWMDRSAKDLQDYFHGQKTRKELIVDEAGGADAETATRSYE